MLFPAYSIHFLRRNQVNLLVNWLDRPYFKQKKKSNITTFWLTEFLKIYYFLLFEKKLKKKKKRIKT